MSTNQELQVYLYIIMMKAGGSSSLTPELTIMELVLLMTKMICALKNFGRKTRHLLDSVQAVNISSLNTADLEIVAGLQGQTSNYSQRLSSDIKKLIVFKKAGLGHSTCSTRLYKNIAGLPIFMYNSQRWFSVNFL